MTGKSTLRRKPRDGETPLVSVVVPVLNGETHIGECIRSLLTTEYDPDRREILVVDNGSTDRTAEVIRSFPVRYLHEARRGPSSARNHGILASRGDIVAFTDADCLATRAWLEEIVSGFATPDVGGVAGEILPFPPRTAAERYAARIRHLSPEKYLSRAIFPFAVTANLAFRREVFDVVGLLDIASPRGGESTDFCTRFFRSTGLRLQLAKRAIVLHRHRSSGKELFLQQWGYGRGHAYLYNKYREEIPWTWRKTAMAYADLGRGALDFMRIGSRYAVGRAGRGDVEFGWFELVRKVALRLGFARESFSRGRFYL